MCSGNYQVIEFISIRYTFYLKSRCQGFFRSPLPTSSWVAVVKSGTEHVRVIFRPGVTLYLPGFCDDTIQIGLNQRKLGYTHSEKGVCCNSLMMIPKLLGQKVKLYPIGVYPVRSTSDGWDPHEGGGEDFSRLAAGVHDEAALNLHVRVLEGDLLCALQGLGVYCHWLKSVKKVGNSQGLSRITKLHQSICSYSFNVDCCYLPRLIGFSFVRLLGKVSPIPLPNMEVFPMAYTMMVDLRSSQLDGVGLLMAVVEASWRLNRLVMKVFMLRASSMLETSSADTWVAKAFAISASAFSLAFWATFARDSVEPAGLPEF